MSLLQPRIAAKQSDGAFSSPHVFYSYIVIPLFHLWSHFFCSGALHTSIPLCIYPFVCVALPPSASTCNTFCPVGSWQAPHLFCSGSCSQNPHLPPPPLLFPIFCMCAKVQGARHCVRANGLKENAYVIANCLQSLGAALKKDMLRRQLRLFAFASLSDCICFKGFVRIIFNPTALWALCAMVWAGVGENTQLNKIHNFMFDTKMDEKRLEMPPQCPVFVVKQCKFTIITILMSSKYKIVSKIQISNGPRCPKYAVSLHFLISNDHKNRYFLCIAWKIA